MILLLVLSLLGLGEAPGDFVVGVVFAKYALGG